jgi:signal peptidase I
VFLSNCCHSRNQQGTRTRYIPQINEWNRDNLGPIYIPQQGKTVANAESLPFYKRIITDYELSDTGDKTILKLQETRSD